MISEVNPFRVLMASTVVPKRRARPHRVSPVVTTYSNSVPDVGVVVGTGVVAAVGAVVGVASTVGVAVAPTAVVAVMVGRGVGEVPATEVLVA
jgi:hypothetical protein